MSMLHVPGKYQVAFSTDVKSKINNLNGQQAREKKRAHNRNAKRLIRRIWNEWNQDTPEFKKEIGQSFVPPYSLQYPSGWTGMMLNGTAVPEKPIQFECVSALSKPDLW